MQRLIVALCGPKQSGKSSVARRLEEAHGFRVCPIAKPLKDACVKMFGFTRDQVDGGAKDVVDPRWGITPRRAMQYLGMDVAQFHMAEHLLPPAGKDGTGGGRGFWMRSFVARNERWPRIVVPDLRFEHEIEALRAFGRLVVVRVDRPGLPPSGDGHLSESEHLAFRPDHVIVNSGSLADLDADVDMWIGGETLSMQGNNEQ